MQRIHTFCRHFDTPNHTSYTYIPIEYHIQYTMYVVGLARTINIRCIYGIFGREITIHTAIYGVYIRFWLTLRIHTFCRNFDTYGRSHQALTPLNMGVVATRRSSTPLLRKGGSKSATCRRDLRVRRVNPFENSQIFDPPF